MTGLAVPLGAGDPAVDPSAEGLVTGPAVPLGGEPGRVVGEAGRVVGEAVPGEAVPGEAVEADAAAAPDPP